MQRWGKENGCHLPKGSLSVSTWLRRMYFYLQIEYSSGKRIRNASCLHEIQQEGYMFRIQSLGETWEPVNFDSEVDPLCHRQMNARLIISTCLPNFYSFVCLAQQSGKLKIVLL